MLRFLLLISAFAVIVGCCFAAEPSTKAKSKTWKTWSPQPGELLPEDLVGTWKIEPSTFYAVDEELAKPGGSHLWTNYSALAFTLRKGGSVVATNFPANLFFDGWPAADTKFGYWGLSTNSSWGVLAHRTVYTNSDLLLCLDFLRTPDGDWNLDAGLWYDPLSWYQKSPGAPRTPAVSLVGARDKAGYVQWSVMLTKQN